MPYCFIKLFFEKYECKELNIKKTNIKQSVYKNTKKIGSRQPNEKSFFER